MITDRCARKRPKAWPPRSGWAGKEKSLLNQTMGMGMQFFCAFLHTRARAEERYPHEGGGGAAAARPTRLPPSLCRQ